MPRKIKATRGHIKPYKTYLFRDKDPVIDELRTIKADGKWKSSTISLKSGVSAGTLTNWFGGKTKRPQSASVEAVGRAMGVMRIWVPYKGRK